METSIQDHEQDTTLDTETIKKRSVTGAIAFVTRTFLLQGIGLVAFGLLGAFLSQSDLGIFFVIDATVGLLVYFSDVGLGAALIQKHGKITKADLATTFTIQQSLTISLSLIAFLFAPQIANFFEFGPASVNLFRALVFAFFTSSLKTIPSILIERDLEFNKLILPQILENIVFYSLAVYLAWKGYGVSSYTYAVIARSIVGLIAIYILKPWKPIFGLDKEVAKGLVKFGAPFQLNSILALFKDRALIIFLGKVLAPAEVGILGWAEKWALTPIRFFADPVLRVTFPAYSRLQDNKAELKKAIEKSIFFVSFLVFPASLGLIAIAPQLLSVIPQYAKWQPAIPALTLYSINAIFSSVSITLTNTLNATGKVKTTLKLMVMWTVLTWILTPLLIRLFGYNGVALASALTASSSLIAIYIVNSIIKVKVLENVLPTLVSSIIMFGLLKFVETLFTVSLVNTGWFIIFGAVVYFTVIVSISKQKVLNEAKIVTKYFKKVTPR